MKGRIPKGFSKGYVPITHERYMNCNWLHCVAGMGIAGRGRCYLNGHWWWKNCPEYKNDLGLTPTSDGE